MVSNDNLGRFYIGGEWRAAQSTEQHPIFNPATEEAVGHIAWAIPAEVDQAVAAARAAFVSWAKTGRAERIDWLRRLIAIYERRLEEMGKVISQDMGAPIDLAVQAQAASGLSHLKVFASTLEKMEFERPFSPEMPEHRIHLEPIGVAALITPWNWPMNQICLKVGAALAAGCTMILKPSEIAPMSAVLFAEFVEEAGLPAGVFNLIHGDGAGVGAALVAHAGTDMVSFTGSTRAGKEISRLAAESLKRVRLELGGKSPNLVFADSDLHARIIHGATGCFSNTGQSCDAPTRMLVEREAYDQAVELVAQVAHDTRVGSPDLPGNHIGPLVSEAQFAKVQALIQKGIDEGARLVAGGLGRPDGMNRGWFVQPTVFADVTPDMTIWKEEIFGPVLSMTPFDSEEEAVELANDTPYGLAAYIQTRDEDRIRRIAPRIQAGIVRMNGSSRAPGSPFGGYKLSGNGREGGVWGIEEFLETKSIAGWPK